VHCFVFGSHMQSASALHVPIVEYCTPQAVRHVVVVPSPPLVLASWQRVSDTHSVTFSDEHADVQRPLYTVHSELTWHASTVVTFVQSRWQAPASSLHTQPNSDAHAVLFVVANLQRVTHVPD